MLMLNCIQEVERMAERGRLLQNTVAKVHASSSVDTSVTNPLLLRRYAEDSPEKPEI